MKRKKLKDAAILVADFETTVTGAKDQSVTEPWACAIVDIEAEDDISSVYIGTSIEDFFNELYSYKKATCYFHNEKFDGSFIVDYLLKSGYQVALVEDEDTHCKRMAKRSEMPNDSFTTSISSKGIWYTITIKHNSHIYEIRDSYKLLPFSVKKIGKDFKTKHQKLDIEYVGDMHAGGVLTEEQKQYIANDVLVVKEGLGQMFKDGHNKLTIGACCLSEFKKGYEENDYNSLFPNLYGENYELPIKGFGSASAGEYIRKSYKGGWCYLRPDRANIEYTADKDFNGIKIAGTTCDVNSLYPSSMHSASGNRYPIGMPHFWRGDAPDFVLNDPKLYYFIRVRTRFYIKENHLPTIQIKHSPLYPGRKWLTSSDYIDKDGNAWRSLTDDINGGTYEMIPELTLTKTDWELMQKHYNLEDTEVLDGCYFNTRIGLFDEYINFYAEIKKKAKGAQRQEAKLFLNNLYGKMATSPEAGFKVPYLDDKGIVHFYTVEAESIKKAAYIPIGAAITSYSRAFTITAAQANYDNFVYSDTDSIHLLCTPDEVKGAPEDPVEFNHWKYEACWDKAIFVRAKTYIEHVTHEDREEVKEPYYNVKCAGMPDRAKDNFISKLTLDPLKDNEDINEYAEKVGVKRPTEEEIAFYKADAMKLTDFKVGLKVPGSLKPKRISGGIVLLNGTYEMLPGLF